MAPVPGPKRCSMSLQGGLEGPVEKAKFGYYGGRRDPLHEDNRQVGGGQNGFTAWVVEWRVRRALP